MKKLLLLVAILCYTLAIGAQASQMKSKMSPWLRSQYKQQQEAVRKNGGPLKANGKTVRNYILTLVESSDDAEAIRRKGGVVWQDFGDGICAAFLPMDSLGVLDQCSGILRMEANAPSSIMNDTSAIILNVDKAWEGKSASTQLPQAFTGKGVIAAVMDVGFDFTHPTFRKDDGTSRFQWFWDSLAESDDPSQLGRIYTSPEQVLTAQHSSDAAFENHGSHVTGSIAGRGLNGRYMGMAPDADIMGGLLPLGEAAGDEFLERLKVYIEAHASDFGDIYPDLIQVEISSAIELVMLSKIFEQVTAAGKPCVMNWSFGNLASFVSDYTLYGKVVSQLVGPGRILVASSGNEGGNMTYLKKESDEEMDHPMYCTSYDDQKLEYTLDVCTAAPAASFVLGLTFDDVEDTLYIDTREVITCSEEIPYTGYIEYMPDGESSTSSPESSMYKVCMYPDDFAYGRTGYVVKIVPPSLHARPDRLTAHLIIDDPVELEFMGDMGMDGAILFATESAPDWRGCQLYTIGYPGGLESIITVGAMHHCSAFTNVLGKTRNYYPAASEEGHLVSFSSCGPSTNGLTKPDVVAPGHNILSALNSFYAEDDGETRERWVTPYTCYQANAFGKEYAMWAMSGTSMSAPIAAGIIALWLQAKPDLTPEDVMGVIERTSHQPEPEFSGTDKNVYYGWGEIDAYAGLLDILGLGTSIPELSKHQPAGVKFRLQGRTLLIDGAEEGTPIRIYTTDGRLVASTPLAGGSISLPADSPAGVYAVQVGKLGSTLIRL